MANCAKCGQPVEDGEKFCKSCGAAVGSEENNQQDLGAKIAQLNNTEDTTKDYDNSDIESNKVMAVLAYIGILVLVPILAAKNSKYARFHANQGLVLFIAEIIYNFVSVIIRAILPLAVVNIILWVISVLFLVLSIIGIVNAATGKAKELPVIGKIRIIK